LVFVLVSAFEVSYQAYGILIAMEIKSTKGLTCHWHIQRGWFS